VGREEKRNIRRKERRQVEKSGKKWKKKIHESQVNTYGKTN
jgi:hypothetical protein